MGLDINELNAESFDRSINGTEELVVVEFYLTNCQNCIAIAPVYEKLAKEFKDTALLTKINARENMEIAYRYGIMATPTFKFFCQGRPIGELVGEVNETLLRNTIKDLIRHRNECVSKSTKLVYEIDGYA